MSTSRLRPLEWTDDTSVAPAHDQTVRRLAEERVVLLDRTGRPCGTAAKRSVHGPDTPLHLGFSCHLVRGDGHLLVTRRAATKATWPGTWSNACCGHPQAGETLRQAVTRRLRDELGVHAERIVIALCDFTYRAVMDNGVVEHEVCPVVVAEIDGELALNPDEVGDAEWLPWATLCDRARERPDTLSPWAVAQITRLAAIGVAPLEWIDRRAVDDPRLDAPIEIRRPPPSSVVGETLDPLATVRSDVDDVLARFVAARSAELSALDPSLGAVAREIEALLAAGGKRLRPAFVYWGHRAAGVDHDPGVASVAASVEMLHTFALLHDDVMDRSATRRGRPAAHQGFAAVHAADRLDGDADWFGASAAILTGDLAFVWADHLLDSSPLRPDAIARARQIYTTLRVEVMAGQYLDLRLERLAAADPEQALRVALLKSGRYTVTRPLQLGLALARPGADLPHAELAAYGDALGVAFQMRDDILGLFGDPATTGKGGADDLRAGKRTLLALRALSLAPAAQREFLVRSLGDPDLDDGAAEQCRAIIAGSGALASVETLLRAQHAVAVDAIGHLPEPARGALHALAATVVDRQS